MNNQSKTPLFVILGLVVGLVIGFFVGNMFNNDTVDAAITNQGASVLATPTTTSGGIIKIFNLPGGGCIVYVSNTVGGAMYLESPCAGAVILSPTGNYTVPSGINTSTLTLEQGTIVLAQAQLQQGKFLKSGQGSLTRTMDKTTIDAIKKFQSANRLTVSGTLDAATKTKLDSKYPLQGNQYAITSSKL